VEIAISVNGVPIRLTDERWFHIVENHDELAGMVFEILATVGEPDFVVKGWQDELLAVRKINSKYLVAAYKEIGGKDGFIITAFITSKIYQIKKRKIIWPKQS